jgi:filamentous hemagglutinin
MERPSFGTVLDFAYAEANSRPDAGVEPTELPPGGLDWSAGAEGGMLADPAMRAMTGLAVDTMALTVLGEGVLGSRAATAVEAPAGGQQLYVGAAQEAASSAAVAVRGGAEAVVDPAKFNYLFGQATGRAHNIARTAQNAQQLARIGIYNTAEGRVILQSHLNQAVQGQENVVQTFTNQHGTFEVRESLLAGPGGFLKIESTWQVMTDGARRFSTLIPKGG